MLLVPKGLNGQWLDCIYWTLAAEMAFYALVFCALLTKKITLRHLAFALTIYSAVFNGFAVLVLSGVIHSEILYFVVLMFRVPCAAWLLCHGCFFALGIWLFMSANRKLTANEWLAVIVTVLSGFGEIYYFASYLLTDIPVISGQSPLLPVAVWAAAVLLIAVAANRARHSTGTASPDASSYLRTDYLRTLGLITYPLYLIHNVVGSAIIRVLVDAGLDQSLAVVVGLSLVVLICWFICAKIEPAIRAQMRQVFSDVGRLPKAELRRPVPIRVMVDSRR
jgi:peptidoglycan/LPS O-acetylase OafA/YrhL